MAPERLTVYPSDNLRESLKIRIPGGGNFATERQVNTVRSSEVTRAPETPAAPVFSVDRERTCPLLLRVFTNVGRHKSLTEYNRGNTPSGELQIYTWLDATLKELSGLIRDVHSEARMRGTYFEFSLVFPDHTGPGYRMRSIGTTQNGTKGQDDGKMLADVRFKIGDYMSVAITPPDERPF